MRRIKSLFADESGAETVEYAIVVGLIAILAGVAYNSSLGTTIQGYLNGLLN